MYGGAAGGGLSPEDTACAPYEPNILFGRLNLWGAVAGDTSSAGGQGGEAAANGTVANVTTDDVCAGSSSRRRLERHLERWMSGDGEGPSEGPWEGPWEGAVAGRRLQRRKRGGGKGAGSPAVSAYLLFVLADNMAMFVFVMVAALTVHAALTNMYRYVLNRKYYRALARQKRTGVPCQELPPFQPLPKALVFPRFEVMLVTIFLTGKGLVMILGASPRALSLRLVSLPLVSPLCQD